MTVRYIKRVSRSWSCELAPTEPHVRLQADERALCSACRKALVVSVWLEGGRRCPWCGVRLATAYRLPVAMP